MTEFDEAKDAKERSEKIWAIYEACFKAGQEQARKETLEEVRATIDAHTTLQWIYAELEALKSKEAKKS